MKIRNNVIAAIRLVPKRLSDSIFPQFPISLGHPLLALEPPLVRELLTPNELRRQTIKIILIAFGMSIILWIATDQPNSTSRFPGDWEFTQGQSLLILGSFVAGWLVNTACFIVTADSFRFVHQNLARWELIRITPLSSNELANVKYVSAVVRVQRVAAGVFGLRLGIAIMAILDWVLSGAFRDYSGDMLYGIAIIIFIAILAFLYTFDPLWRAKLLSARYLIESARNSNIVVFYFQAGIATIGVFIQSSLLIGGYFAICLWILAGGALIQSRLLLLIVIPLICILMVLTIYNFYRDACKDILSDLIDVLECAQ